jgi:hypothetical protein
MIQSRPAGGAVSAHVQPTKQVADSSNGMLRQMRQQLAAAAHSQAGTFWKSFVQKNHMERVAHKKL